MSITPKHKNNPTASGLTPKSGPDNSKQNINRNN